MVVLFVVGGVHDGFIVVCLFFVKQKTAYEMRISDWSSDVCSSDLPGQVTAQVTQNVYDSPTGRILLIPQGARLIGDYDSEISVGQERVLLAWNRLILPGGRLIRPDRQPSPDARPGASCVGLEGASAWRYGWRRDQQKKQK